ncbi:LmbU family transcriptional regulator [Nonomuraea muscovyensis]|uniref:Uncharacterized protein n=1 Tax=Nonomuraea muscovyensis TaxID=1124761 RepID=A0A7X0C9R7_9ACTN|nr:LmbU family transcriptional regulator [Nonomuraea muscovyensis]MBB6350115.1 hypothetical protein [Nonomuraea muscovyensis]MDF2705410.1 hypothetical protein [Nonomuraea muscovyensis]
MTIMRVMSVDQLLEAENQASGRGKPLRRPARDRLGVGSAAATRRASLRLPPRLPIEEWRRIGAQIGLISDASKWWLGDWLVYGQTEYPDRYLQAIERTSLDYQTLRNYAWVARKFDVGRRRPGLSVQHHVEVAALPEPDQDRWLTEAETHRWSRNELRRRIRGEAATETGRPGRTRAPAVSVKPSAEQRERWEEAATKVNRDLASWMVHVLDEAAGQDRPG